MATLSFALLLVNFIHSAFIMVGTEPLATMRDPGTTDHNLLGFDPISTESGKYCSMDVQYSRANCSSRGLKEVPRDIPSYTLHLSLSYNWIERIYNDSFSHLKDLVDISLQYNVIFEIEEGAFFDLHLLQSVNLIGNRLSVLPSHLYRQNYYLTDIFLRNNTLTEIPDLVLKAPNISFIDFGLNFINSANFRMNFDTTCDLMYIDLSGNAINSLENDSLKNLEVCIKITFIDFSSNSISSLDPQSLQGINIGGISFEGNPLFEKGVEEVFYASMRAPTLTHISVATSNLTSLSAKTFSPLTNSPLVSISLSKNDISSIPENVFHFLTRLRKLFLSENKIQVISPRSFNNMSSMKQLHLDGNAIVQLNTLGIWEPPLRSLSLGNNLLHEIPSKVFIGLGSLIYLTLHFNSIRIIYHDSFDGLNSLELLNLNGNSLINPPRFGAIPTLRNLYLSSSGINSLDPENTFTGLNVLSELRLDKNYLHISDLWINERNISTFRNLTKLKHLDLSANNLIQSEIPSGCFEGLYNLEMLNLQGMSLPKLDQDLLKGLSNLEMLSLENNELKDIHPETFRDQGKLFSLYLGRNPIAGLDDNVFAQTKKISLLSLHKTNIEVITEKALGPIIPSLSTLDLSNKELSCNCENKWFRNWMQNSSVEIILDETVCSINSPQELQGKSFREFDSPLYCGPDIILYCGVSVVSVLVIVILVVLYYNRWWINYKCFLLRLCIIGYSEIIETRDYKYDINIVYDDDHQEWVNEYLVPNIQEREPELNILVGDEMLPLGMYRLDAVAHVIDNSYKSVFVVSQSAIKDSWFLTKLHIALQHVNHAKRDAVLFVFLDDILGEDLPYLIRLLMSINRPYLKWDEDPRYQEYFWELFMKSIKVTTMINYTIPM
nr:toll-like receptor 3 [Lytechinus pictus]